MFTAAVLLFPTYRDFSAMTAVLRPGNAGEVQTIIRELVATGQSAEVIGRGSKREVGRPPRTDAQLDLSALTGITLYEPEELIVSAHAGTPLDAIEAVLADHGQQLAFEPVVHSGLFGPGGASIGGVVAANISGPRRIKAGAARDHFLGVKAVSGVGNSFKSGGRVVKNVTGYDLCKLLAGSWGTLAVMTELTLKVLPRPETEVSVVVGGLDDIRANAAMTAVMGSACDVSGAAHRSAVGRGAAATLFRLEGFSPSVVHRLTMLRDLLGSFGEIAVLDEFESRRAWRDIATLEGFALPDDMVWRLSVPPADGARVMAAIMAAIDDKLAARALYDWAGALVWVALSGADPAAGIVREAARRVGGHAMLFRASEAVRRSLEVFEPLPPTVAALSSRIKGRFDPKGVFNPGRMGDAR
jgi:glycolate oxidase FAD binding subunit